MNRQVHGAETARLFSLSVFLMNTPAFMNTSLLTLNLINSGPVSLSLRQLILFHIQASFSPDESAHTKLPLCFSVCQLCRRCAAKLWQYCWKCVGTHGASKQEFTVQSQVLKQPLFFYSKRERGRQKVIQKNGSGIRKSILWVYCTWLNWYVRSTEKTFSWISSCYRAGGLTVDRYNVVSCIASALQSWLRLSDELAKIRLWSHCGWKMDIGPHRNFTS